MTEYQNMVAAAKDFHMTIEVDATKLIETIEQLSKHLPERIDFVGGPMDGTSYYIKPKDTRPKWLLITLAGLTSVYELGECEFWRYYEWKSDTTLL